MTKNMKIQKKVFTTKTTQNVQKYVQNLKQSVQPNPDSSKLAAKVPKFLITTLIIDYHR